MDREGILRRWPVYVNFTQVIVEDVVKQKSNS